MATKNNPTNPLLKCDDYTRRIAVLETEKRTALAAYFQISIGMLYKMLGTSRYPERYIEKRALQDKVRYEAVTNYGGKFENISFTVC